MFKKLFFLSVILLIVCLALGIYGYICFNDRLNGLQAEKSVSTTPEPSEIAENVSTVTAAELLTIDFTNGNSRETYFSVHNVAEAYKTAKGKNVKVGILDHSFAMNRHQELYKAGKDFTGNEDELKSEEGHGYWMARVLREIAPECDIYALCTWAGDEGTKADNMINAIHWAIENDIDILTYSDAQFSASNSWKLDEAIDLAVSKGIVTTFIHCKNENNLWPTGMFTFENTKGGRNPDLNILHYDYNTLIVERYVAALNSGGVFENGDNIPYFSVSSTSPVTAGFVAILKSVNNTLTPKDYKDILVKTSYHEDFYDWNFKETYPCERVVDLPKAVDYLIENYGSTN